MHRPPPSSWRTIGVIAALATSYVLAGRLGLSFAAVNPSATPLWPPTGLALAALLLFGDRVWPGILIGALAVNLPINGSFTPALAIAVGNTLEGIVASYLVRRFAHGAAAFARARDIFRFAILAGLVSPMVSATIGTTTLRLGGYAPWADYGSIWLTWWVGDGAGALLFAPTLVLWAAPDALSALRHRWWEAGALLLAVLLVGQLLFANLSPPGYPLTFLPFPVLLWAAFRFSPRESTLAVVVLMTMAVWGTTRGLGPFADLGPNEALLLLHVFLATIAVTSLLAAALVAERRRVEARLEAAQEAPARLAAIVADSDDAIVSKTLDDIITSWNRAAEELYGFTAAEAIGRPITLIIPDDRRPEEDAVLARIRRGEAVQHFETVRVRKDGTRVDVSLTISPIRNQSGVIVGASKIARDISERRHLEEERRAFLAREHAGRAEAEAANRAKDEFLALLGHELRNPLGAIVSAVQVLGLVGAQEDRADRARQIITRQVQHLTRLVADLLDVGRVTAGKIVLDRRPLDLADAVERCLAALTASGKTERHALLVETEPVWVDADEVRLEQIIANLVDNAVKYTPSRGRIRVSVRPVEGHAILRVEDDGIGMSPELLDRVFDLFVQGDRTLERASGGLGIGLMLVRRLVELHGGTVEAASEGPGQGSTFTVRLPSRLAPVAPSRHEAALPESRVRRRLLVVEDDRDVRESLRTMLELTGHEVHAAEDGPSGLAAIRRLAPDIALVDIGLPGLDGYEVARRVRAEPGGAKPVLVALTGYGSAEDRERAHEAGFDLHLVKPITSDQLARILGDAQTRVLERSDGTAARARSSDEQTD
jgi:PAS domain S-box-containing protein